MSTTCAFCFSDTSFLAYSEHLCLHCGDRMQGFDPEQVMELAKRFAKAVAELKIAREHIAALEEPW